MCYYKSLVSVGGSDVHIEADSSKKVVDKQDALSIRSDHDVVGFK